MKIAGLILAGGQSRRLGAHKFQTLLGDRPLLDHVAAGLAPQVGAMAVNLPPDCTHEKITVLHEPEGKREGPLAGVLLGLEWAQSVGADTLVTMPVDVPFSPHDIVAQLLTHSKEQEPVCAVEGGRRHGLCALWPVVCLPAFTIAYTDGNIRTVNRMLDLLQVQEVAFEAIGNEQFFNINTTVDIEKARQILLRTKDLE